MNAQRLHVLLVDDEEPLLATAAAILSDDFEVQTARDTASALRVLATHSFDVVCTDILMPPGANGIQLLREAVGKYPHLAGVLVTGSREYLDHRDMTQAQGQFYLVLKPYRAEDLVGTIRRAAEASRVKKEMSSLSTVLAGRKKRGMS